MNAAMQAMESMQCVPRRWLILATVAIAQLVIVLDRRAGVRQPAAARRAAAHV